jgi:DNA-binding transcriptional ArsR family regulator
MRVEKKGSLMSKEEMIPFELLRKQADCLKVLAHPYRLRIIEILSDKRVTVTDLATILDIPRNATSQHLKLMQTHGLLDRERSGKTVFYSIKDPQALMVLNCIREKCELGLVPTY